MDVYPIEYTSQPSPLVFIQGLGKDGIPQGSAKDLKRPSTPIVHNPLLINADKITRKQETVRASSGLELVSLFQKHSLSDDCVWDDDLIKSQSGAPVAKYRLKFIDNEFLLPSFANGVDATDTGTEDEAPTTPINAIKSPLSPFNESSDLFPDGIISPNWIQKYKDIVPAVFISIHELDADVAETEQKTQDEELIEEIKYLRKNIVNRGIKFLSILVCSRSTILNPELMERVTHIKKQTGLQNRNSLLFLPSGTEKELKSFVTQVMTLVKPLSLEFYNTVEKKIKRKKSRQSSAQLSQIPQGLLQPFWDVRYCIKLALIQEFKAALEPASKFWEQSYAAMLEIFQSFPKDHARWNEFRMLLDFIMVHIVKNLLYLEDASAAFYKFDSHLQQVISFLKKHDFKPKSYPVLTWLNYQFKWFAGLLDYVPKEIIPIDVPYEITNLSRLSMPNAGYLYLQAVSLNEKRKLQAKELQNDNYLDTYLALPLEDETKFDYDTESVGLLKRALLVFDKSKNFRKTENYIKFEIAHYFYRMGKYNDAVEQYEECYDFSLNNGNWKQLSYAIARKIYDCHIQLGDNKNAIKYLFELATLSDTRLPFEPTIHKEEEPIELKTAIFDVGFFFKNSNAPISQDCQAQLSITSNLSSFIRNDLHIKKLVLEFEDTSSILPIVLEQHGPGSALQLVELEKRDSQYEGSASLSVLPGVQVFQFAKLAAGKVGKSTLRPFIKLFAKYKDLVPLEFTIPLRIESESHRYPWYSQKEKGLHIDYYKINDPLTMTILPRRPETHVSVESSKNCYLGESASIPIVIKNDDREKVSVSFEPLIDIEWHWGDGEKLVEIGPKSSVSQNLVLVIPANYAQKLLKFPLQVSFFAAENSEIPIKETVSVSIPILQPLKTKLSVIPRFREKDMPTPFAEFESSIPIPERYWCARSEIALNSEVEFVDLKLTVKHPAEYVSSVIEGEKSTIKSVDAVTVDEYFSTKSGDGNIHREIPVTLQATISWKRRASNVVNHFECPPLELSLSLFDPRVLLVASESKDGVKLKYIIENPAPRIFQFSTQLIENQGYTVTGDLKNNTFPVLPFTRQELIYYVNTQVIGAKLPALKVFDLQYKVNLPILPTNDLVKVEGEEVLYVKPT